MHAPRFYILAMKIRWSEDQSLCWSRKTPTSVFVCIPGAPQHSSSDSTGFNEIQYDSEDSTDPSWTRESWVWTRESWDELKERWVSTESNQSLTLNPNATKTIPSPIALAPTTLTLTTLTLPNHLETNYLILTLRLSQSPITHSPNIPNSNNP